MRLADKILQRISVVFNVSCVNIYAVASILRIVTLRYQSAFL